MKYEDLLADWPYKKVGGKCLSEFLTFDGDLDYWKLHRFKFVKYLYGIPFRSTKQRYDPIVRNKKDPLIIRLRTRAIYLAVELYLWIVILYYFFLSLRKVKDQKPADVIILSHIAEVKLEGDKISEIYRLEGVRKVLKDYSVLICSPLLTPWKSRKNANMLNNYVTREVFKDALAESVALRKRWRDIDRNELDSVFDGKYDFVKEDIGFIFSLPFLIAVMTNYFAIKSALKKLKAKTVLTISGIRERCALAAAHKVGIPGVFIAHSFLINGKYFDFYSSTNYLVYNEVDKKSIATDSKVRTSNIHVIGPYMIDDVIKRYGRRNSEGYTLVLAQPLYQDYGASIKGMLSILFMDLEGEIRIKLHPRDKHPEIWREVLPNAQVVAGKNTNNNEEILYDAISRSAVVVGFFSNTIIDALALGKPVVQVSLDEKIYFKETQSIVRIRHTENLNEAIRTAKRKKNSDKIKKDAELFYYGLDGKSCERAVKAITGLTKKNVRKD
jgi:hypothetical protein